MRPAEEVIKYANMLNTENLSALRSGNISIRHDDGFNNPFWSKIFIFKM